MLGTCVVQVALQQHLIVGYRTEVVGFSQERKGVIPIGHPRHIVKYCKRFEKVLLASSFFTDEQQSLLLIFSPLFWMSLCVADIQEGLVVDTTFEEQEGKGEHVS
jgi:hypothetical protein